MHALPAAGFQSVVGRGIQNEEGFWAGSAQWLRESGRMDGLGVEISRLSEAGEAVFACGQGTDVWALVSVTDPIRTEAERVMRSLRKMGVEKIVILTGDTRENSKAVAHLVGADELRTDQLPADKAARVRELRTEYRHVAMTGDGVNDAEALSSASLGVSLGMSGADVAREISDVVLMSGDLHCLPFLRRHARKTMRIVKENIGFALAMKGLFLIAAGAGVATLWMAVAADMGATFAVTLNGLRLLRAREREF